MASPAAHASYVICLRHFRTSLPELYTRLNAFFAVAAFQLGVCAGLLSMHRYIVYKKRLEPACTCSTPQRSSCSRKTNCALNEMGGPRSSHAAAPNYENVEGRCLGINPGRPPRGETMPRPVRPRGRRSGNRPRTGIPTGSAVAEMPPMSARRRKFRSWQCVEERDARMPGHMPPSGAARHCRAGPPLANSFDASRRCTQ